LRAKKRYFSVAPAGHNGEFGSSRARGKKKVAWRHYVLRE